MSVPPLMNEWMAGAVGRTRPVSAVCLAGVSPGRHGIFIFPAGPLSRRNGDAVNAAMSAGSADGRTAERMPGGGSRRRTADNCRKGHTP